MNPELSGEYYRRRNQIRKAFVLFIFSVVISMLVLFALSFAEGFIIRYFMMEGTTLSHLTIGIVLMSVYLGFYTIILSKLTLHIAYHAEKSSLTQAIVTTVFTMAYAYLFYKIQNIPFVLSLLLCKLFSSMLFFRFWRFEINEDSYLLSGKLPSRNLMISWKAFFVCKWVLCAAWLLSLLGATIALLSMHPTIQLRGWESFALLGTFYFIFRMFIRSPYSRPLL